MPRPLQCALLLLAATSCSVGASQQPDSVLTVTGRERVTWDQEVLPETSVGHYAFAVYVNGERVPLPDATCEGERKTDGFTCSAPLPRLPRGRSSLEFVAIANGEESDRSEPLELQVGSDQAQTFASAAATDNGGAVRIHTIAHGFQSPTDLALLPDGRLLVAERRGVVRVVANGAVLQEPAMVLDDVAEGDGLGMFAVAAHPDFARNHLVYLTYTAKLSNGRAAYRVIRAREINNTLGEVAVILDSGPASAPAWMSARFGPDRMLYVGVAACAGCGSIFRGVVLRLNDDGSTPRDRSSASPVFLRDLSLPVGLSWRSDQLWVADWSPASTAIIATTAGRTSRFTADVRAGAAAVTSDNTSAVLMTRPHGAGLEQYARRGSLSLLDPAGAMLPASMTVHALIQAPDGALYVCASDGANETARLIRVTGLQ